MRNSVLFEKCLTKYIFKHRIRDYKEFVMTPFLMISDICVIFRVKQRKQKE